MLPDKSAKQVRYRRSEAIAGPNSAHRRGFTLVEMLVVLAILVLLFALLFAPMITGLQLATEARVRTSMQDAARLAMEQIRRELSDAIYIYPSPTFRLAGPDGTLGTDDDEAVTDYSQIVFVKAARDGSGRLLTPIRPDTYADGDMRAIRYLVQLTTLDQLWSGENPFALYRQEGYYLWDAEQRRYVFGSRDTDGEFIPGGVVSQNIMTPTTGADIPPSSTVCTACGVSTPGYVAFCPDDCGEVENGNDNGSNAGQGQVVHLHSGIRFAPHRVEGDTLSASEHNTLYTGRHGAWRGFQNDGSIFLPETALSSAESLMQPRMILYRYSDETNSYSDVALDSHTNMRSAVNLRWNVHDGTVRIGNYEIVEVSVDVSDLASPPARGEGDFFRITVTDADDSSLSDSYDAAGHISGDRITSVVPIYGTAPVGWQDPLMPVGFGIYPDDVDGADIPIEAKVVPDSVYVRVAATLADGSVRRTEYSATDILDQERIGRFQFVQYQEPGDRYCEVRFNRWDPPSPEMFGELEDFTITLLFYYRRNFEAETGRDDILVADYFTAELMNVTLTLNRLRDPEPAYEGADSLVVPTDLKVHKVVMQDQVQVRNIR